MNTRHTLSVRTSGASRILAFPTSVLLTAVLAACGGGNGQQAASPDSANNAADTAAAVATAAAASPMCFYEHVNYQGASFCASADSNWVGGAWNDRVSSVKVAAGYKVTLFQDINYGGKTLVLTGDNANLVPLGFNDPASSFKITAPSVATSKVGTIQIAQSELFNSDDAALVLVAEQAGAAEGQRRGHHRRRGQAHGPPAHRQRQRRHVHRHAADGADRGAAHRRARRPELRRFVHRHHPGRLREVRACAWRCSSTPRRPPR